MDNQTPTSRRFMLENEVAELFVVKPQTLRLWRAQKKGPPYLKVSGRAIRYERQAVEKFILENTH